MGNPVANPVIVLREEFDGWAVLLMPLCYRRLLGLRSALDRP
jgi:hypothetical protein